MGKKKGPAGKKHPSLAEVQGEVEQYVIEQLQAEDGYKKLKQGVRVPIGNAYCQPDGVSRGKIVEVYARVGKLKAGQSKKVATDTLKFAAIQRQPDYENAKCEIWFVDEDAKGSVTGWMKEAADELNVELKVLPNLPDRFRKKLLKAQEQQGRGNVTAGN